MNGEPLPRDHGFPARLIVPGWVGIASIKWLGELRVTTSVVDSPWNTKWYRMHGAGWSGADATLDRMPPKSVVDATGDLAVGRLSVLRGRAWSGEATIRMVEVSTDGGATWDEASLTGANEPSSWVAWEHPWTPAASGAHVLLTPGHRQPRAGPSPSWRPTTRTATSSPRSYADRSPSPTPAGGRRASAGEPRNTLNRCGPAADR